MQSGSYERIFIDNVVQDSVLRFRIDITFANFMIFAL